MRVRFSIDKNANNGRSPIFLIAAERTSFEGYNDLFKLQACAEYGKAIKEGLLVFPEKGLKGRIPFSALR
jgi:hypothetical protein